MSQQSGGSRRRLQWTLGVLAAIPVASAMGEIVRGPQGVPGGFTRCDSDRGQFSGCPTYSNSAVGPVIWSRRHIEQSPAVLLAAATIAFRGASCG